MSRVHELRAEIERTEEQIGKLSESIDMTQEGIDHIDIDLSNTVAEYVAETGKQPHDYYRWRTRAKWARHHKATAIRQDTAKVRALESHKTNLYLQLHAVQSGYRGQHPKLLAIAAYYLLMEVMTTCEYRPDASQMGLIAELKIMAESIRQEEEATT